MAGECDRKHIGCEGSDGPLLVNRSSFSIAENGVRSYTEEYLISGPTEAESLLGNTLPILPGATVRSVNGRQDACGEWIATVNYATEPGDPGGDCPPDEIVITGSAIQSSWSDHVCFNEVISDLPFNGTKPSQAWAIPTFEKTPTRADPCDPSSALLPEAQWPCEEKTIPGFNINAFSDPSSFAAKVFGGSTVYNHGSYEVTVTSYFNGSPPDIWGVVGYPAQPPGIPSTTGIYGLVRSGAVYEPGEGHTCGRRVLVYWMSTRPWPSINPNNCSVIPPP